MRRAVYHQVEEAHYSMDRLRLADLVDLSETGAAVLLDYI